MEKIRIMQVGLGPLGVKMLNMAATRSGEQVVAVFDIDPAKIGKTLHAIGVSGFESMVVSNDLQQAIERGRPDVAILTTVSDMERITPQIEAIVKWGIPVVSTCEELLYAWEESPELASRVDRAAMEAGVPVLGTGVNPGFLMDTLPAFLTSVCSHVERIEVLRFQDARYRRFPFQKKIGAGLTIEEYNAKRSNGTLRHVGLTESIQFIARQVGWKLTRVEDNLTPVMAVDEIRTPAMTISAGCASGVRQVGLGYIGETEKIKLVFQASVGEPESYDEVRVHGVPGFTSRIEGGINGDIATCAITLNAAHSIRHASPGLRSMADVPLVTCK